jgi:hypothetical protein
MANVDRDALPTVEQAVEKLRELAATERSARPTSPEPEKQLDATAADIRLAFSLSDNAQSFVQALEQQGIHLAAVTAAEAKRSQADRDAAAEPGGGPAYQPGEFVAVGPLGQFYALDRNTTGQEPTGPRKFLAPLDRSQFQGIEATQEQLALRAEQFIAVTEAAPSLDQHLAAGKARETLADIFSTPSPPVPEKKSVEVQTEREASEPKKIDWPRYIDDRDYRRQVQQRQQREQPKTERERTPDLER